MVRVDPRTRGRYLREMATLHASDTPFLVDARSLAAALAAAPDVRPLVIDARKPADYAAGHIPGAVSLSTYECFVRSTSPEDLATFAADMARLYAAAGVTADRPIVVCEDATGMRAARELWILEFLGHRRVRLLDGGLGAWKASGGAGSTAASVPVAATFAPAPDLAMAIGLDEIAAAAGASPHGGGLLLVDTRARKEFDGTGGHDCCPWQGRIPGAIHLEWSDLVDPVEGCFRTGPDIAARLAAAAGTAIGPERTLVPYCHRGARSAVVTCALRLAGFTGVRNFIGSWHEWSHRFPAPGR